MSYERDEMAADGGFVRLECSWCRKMFWSDWSRYCKSCSAGPVGDYADVIDAQDAGLRPKEGVWDK